MCRGLMSLDLPKSNQTTTIGKLLLYLSHRSPLLQVWYLRETFSVLVGNVSQFRFFQNERMNPERRTPVSSVCLWLFAKPLCSVSDRLGPAQYVVSRTTKENTTTRLLRSEDDQEPSANPRYSFSPQKETYRNFEKWQRSLRGKAPKPTLEAWAAAWVRQEPRKLEWNNKSPRLCRSLVLTKENKKAFIRYSGCETLNRKWLSRIASAHACLPQVASAKFWVAETVSSEARRFYSRKKHERTAFFLSLQK